MSPPITGLDHALIGVRDLEDARAAYGRLGFTVTPRGSHIGWGTANYCIMFADDYVELLGVVDASKFTNNLDVFLARREGLLGLAFATDDAAATYAALERAGVPAEPPEDLARNLELPEGTVRPAFKLVHLAPEATPAVPSFVCQHLSPELVRRPAWLEHANGARALIGVTVVVDDPEAVADAYARLFGDDAVARTRNMVAVRIGRAALVFARARAIAGAYPEIAGEALADLPLIAAMAIEVDDLAKAEAALAAGGVGGLRRADGVVVVPPTAACGVVVEFVRGG